MNRHVGWYSRGSHIDFLPKLSQKLINKGIISQSSFICHTREEGRKLNNTHNINPSILGDYFFDKRNSYEFKEEEIYKLQEKYNFLPLRQIMWSEIYEENSSEEELIFHLCTHFDFWEEFIEKNKITHIVSELPSIMSTSVLWVVCKKMGVHFISLGDWCIDGRLVFNSEWGCEVDGLKEKLDNLEINKSSESYQFSITYLDKMVNKPERPTYLSFDPVSGKKLKVNQSFSSPLSKFPRIPKLKELIAIPKKLRETRETYYINSPRRLRNYLYWSRSVLRTFLHKYYKILERDVDVTRENYFIFPLHILKEWGDYSWMGLKYPNIINVIEECAACLPIGYKLYVKEHPSHFPEKSFSFYHAIKNIPNVRLIHPKENNFNLIRNSKGVITLGSTMGWEAFLMGKIVIVLVNIWYEHLPGVYKATNLSELAGLLQQNLDLPIASKAEKIKSIYCLYESSFDGVIYPVDQLNEDKNIEKFTLPFKDLLEKFDGLTS